MLKIFSSLDLTFAKKQKTKKNSSLDPHSWCSATDIPTPKRVECPPPPPPTCLCLWARHLVSIVVRNIIGTFLGYYLKCLMSIKQKFILTPWNVTCKFYFLLSLFPRTFEPYRVPPNSKKVKMGKKWSEKKWTPESLQRVDEVKKLKAQLRWVLSFLLAPRLPCPPSPSDICHHFRTRDCPKFKRKTQFVLIRDVAYSKCHQRMDKI